MKRQRHNFRLSSTPSRKTTMYAQRLKQSSRLLACILSLIATVTAHGQIRQALEYENAHNVLHGPYRGPAGAGFAGTEHIGYGEILNFVIYGHEDDNGQVGATGIREAFFKEGETGTWDRSLVRLYEGFNASGREIFPCAPDDDPTDGGECEIPGVSGDHFEFSLKVLGTRSLGVQEVRISLHYRLVGISLTKTFHTGDLLHQDIVPTGFAPMGPTNPNVPILDIQHGACRLVVPVGAQSEMIGQSMMYYKSLSSIPTPILAGSSHVLLPGVAEFIYLADREDYTPEETATGTPGTPWCGYMPGWQTNLPRHVYSPDGTEYAYTMGRAIGRKHFLEHIIPPGLATTDPGTVTYDYGNTESDLYEYKVVKAIYDGASPNHYIEFIRELYTEKVLFIKTGRGWDPASDSDPTPAEPGEEKIWQVTTDANGWIASITQPDGQILRRYAHNVAGQLTAVFDASNNLLETYTYTDNGNKPGDLLAVQRHQGGAEPALVENYSYDVPEPYTIVKTETPGQGAPPRVTTYRYGMPPADPQDVDNDRSNLLLSAEVAGIAEQYAWDWDNPRGNLVLTQVTFADGRDLRHEYHSYAPDMPTAFRARSTYGTASARLNVWDVDYDLWTVDPGSGDSQLKNWPQILATRDAEGRETLIDYLDEQFRTPLRITGPDVQLGFSQGPSIVEYEYYAGGLSNRLLKRRKIQMTDTQWQVQEYRYDDLQRLIEVVSDPDGEALSTRWMDRVGGFVHEELRADGLPNIQIDPDGTYSRFTYDSIGRLTSQKKYLTPGSESGGYYETDYTYDNKGLLEIVDVRLRDQNGSPLTGTEAGTYRTRYYYDLQGRVTQVQTGKASGSTTVVDKSQHWGITYNDLDEIVRRVQIDGRFEQYNYDDHGRIAQQLSGYGANPATQSGGTLYAAQNAQYFYDAIGRLDRVEYGDGRIVDYNFQRDEFGRPLRIRMEPDGGEERLTYDPSGRIASRRIFDADGSTLLSDVDLFYDEAGRLFQEVNWALQPGASTQHTLLRYNRDGSLNRTLVKGANPCNGTINSQITDIIGQPGDTYVDYAYDTLGRISQITSPTDSVTCNGGSASIAETVQHYAWDIPNRTLTVTDGWGSPGARQQKMYYDALGRTIRADEPTGAYSRMTYNSLSAPRSLQVFDTPAQGGGLIASRTWQYLPNGQLTQQTAQDPAGVLPDAITSLAYFDTSEPQKAGRLQSITSPLGEAISYDYDDASLIWQMTDPASNERILDWDDSGKIEQLTHKDVRTGQSNPSLTRRFNYAYDNPWQNNMRLQRNGTGPDIDIVRNALGQTREVTDFRGVRTDYQYDTSGAPLQVTEDAGGLSRQTFYQYDPRGGLRRLTANPGGGLPGQITEFYRGPLGGVLQVQYPDAAPNSVTRAYNAFGELISHTDQANQQITLEHDISGTDRQTIHTDEADYIYTRDGLGRLVQATVEVAGLPQSIVDFNYDGFGRLSSETLTYDGTAHTVSYAYNSGGQLTQMTYPSGQVLDLTGGAALDELGRPLAVQFDGALLAQYQYEGPRVRQMRLYAPGDANPSDPFMQLDLDYDSLGRLSERHWQSRGDYGLQTAEVQTYTYDAGDRITQILSSMANHSVQLVVDSLSRITRLVRGSKHPWWPVFNPYSAVYDEKRQDMDLVGNVHEQTVRQARGDGGFDTLEIDRTFNEANEAVETTRLLNEEEIAPLSLVYDHTGRLIADGSQHYQYDPFGRLIAVYLQNDAVLLPDGTVAEGTLGAQLTSFTYDALGRRVAQEIFPAAADRLPAGTAPGRQLYVHAGNRVLETHDLDAGRDEASLIQRSFYGPEGLDHKLRTDQKQPDGTYQNFYFATDHVSTPKLTAIPEAGLRDGGSVAKLVERYAYDASGRMTVMPADCLDADVDCDGIVGAVDLVKVRNAFGPAEPEQRTDVCGNSSEPDGVVNELDLACVREQLGKGMNLDPLRGGDDGPKPDRSIGLHGLTHDHATGLLFARARYYHPRLGTWLQRDPKGYIDGSNLYTAFANNAVQYTDPMGTETGLVAPDGWNNGSEVYYYHDLFFGLFEAKRIPVGHYFYVNGEKIIVCYGSHQGGIGPVIVMPFKSVEQWAKQTEVGSSDYDDFVDIYSTKFDRQTGKKIRVTEGEKVRQIFMQINMEASQLRDQFANSLDLMNIIADPGYMLLSGESLVTETTVKPQERFAAGVCTALEFAPAVRVAGSALKAKLPISAVKGAGNIRRIDNLIPESLILEEGMGVNAVATKSGTLADDIICTVNLNANEAISNFGVYEIYVNGSIYKVGKADLARVTKSSGLPTRLHQQLRKLRLQFGRRNVTGRVVDDLGVVTTEAAKQAEYARILKWYEETYLPMGNRKSFKP